MKTRVLVSAVMAATLGFASGSWAQTAGVDPVLAHKRELTRQYMDIMNINKVMEQVSASVFNALVPPGEDTKLTTAMREAMSESTAIYFPRMMDRLVDVYAETMTEEELVALVQFYGSPVGKSVMSKLGQLSQASVPVMQEFMPQFQRDMLTRLCGKITCSNEMQDKLKSLSS